MVAHACLAAVGGPASRTFVPHLLPKDQLAAGLALNRIASQATMLVGPALGGLVVGALGVAGCYLVDALTFVVALYGVLGLPPITPVGEPARPGLRGVLDGLVFLARTPVVRGALITDLATTVLSMPVSLFPLINADLGNVRGGLVADATSGMTALVSGGLLCLGAVAVVGAATPALRRRPSGIVG